MSNERQLIISCGIARKLIHLGYTVIDIEPNNQYPDRTVFVFKNTQALTKDLQLIKQQMKERNKQNEHK